MNSNLIDQLVEPFMQCRRPMIVHNGEPRTSVDHTRSAIQKDFGMLHRDEVDVDKCSMIICDSSLMSDEAILYFLPSLIRHIANQEVFTGEILAHRLGDLRIAMNIEQNNAVRSIIDIIHEIENELE